MQVNHHLPSLISLPPLYQPTHFSSHLFAGKNVGLHRQSRGFKAGRRRNTGGRAGLQVHLRQGWSHGVASWLRIPLGLFQVLLLI